MRRQQGSPNPAPKLDLAKYRFSRSVQLTRVGLTLADLEKLVLEAQMRGFSRDSSVNLYPRDRYDMEDIIIVHDSVRTGG